MYSKMPIIPYGKATVTIGLQHFFNICAFTQRIAKPHVMPVGTIYTTLIHAKPHFPIVEPMHPKNTAWQ